MLGMFTGNPTKNKTVLFTKYQFRSEEHAVAAAAVRLQQSETVQPPDRARNTATTNHWHGWGMHCTVSRSATICW